MEAQFLVQGRGASSRYRALQYFPGLEARGIRCRSRRFPSLLDLPAALREARTAGALFIQRKQAGFLTAFLLRRAAGRIIYDFDDALWVRSSRHASPESRTRQARFRRMLGMADAVVAGNSYLAEEASRWHRRVTVIPTPIDTARYAVRPDAGDPDRVVLGWIGARATLPYLEGIGPALAEAHRKDPRIRLKVISDVFPGPLGLPVDEVPWREETEAAELASLDIGLMPLTDDPWSRGKCGLKALQYLAAGVPVVASPVGVNAEVVRDGEEGFGARSPADWAARILDLAGDLSLRRSLGLNGRRRVEEKYSLAACLPLMESVLRG